MNLNKTLLAGNLTRDPEMLVTPKGTAIVQFGIAITRKYKGDSGALMEETTFVDCEAWSKTAESISKFFTKGKPIFVEGRLKLDSWEDKTSGQKRSKLKVVVDSFQFVGRREEASEGVREDAKPERHSVPSRNDVDEDVPF